MYKVLNVSNYSDSFVKDGKNISYSRILLIVKNGNKVPEFVSVNPNVLSDVDVKTLIGKDINLSYSFDEYKKKFYLSKIEVVKKNEKNSDKSFQL